MTKILSTGLLLWLFLLSPLSGSAQEVDSLISLAQVKKDFEQALIETESAEDTTAVYLSHLKRLIRRGNYQEADDILQFALPNFIATGDSTMLAELYENRAFMYKVQRRFPKALEDYLWLKAFYENSGNKNKLAETYTLMAEYYRAFHSYDLMDKHLKMANEIINEGHASRSTIAYWYSRKTSWCTQYLGDEDSIQYNALKGLALADEPASLYTKALLLNELGFLYNNQGKAQEVYLPYYEEARRILFDLERYRDYVEVTNNYLRGVNIFAPEKAVDILEQIIPLQKENNWYSSLVSTLNVAKNHYRQLSVYDSEQEINNDINNARMMEIISDKEIALNDLALNYQNQLTTKELEVQAQRAQLAEAEAKGNKTAFAIAAIIATSLAVITLIIGRFNRRIRVQNKLLEERKKAIEVTNNKLEKSLEQERALYKELNHRVKNNLSVLSGLIYLQEAEEANNEFKNSLAKLRGRVKSMAIAHDSLYNSETSGSIDFGHYLEQLFKDLTNALSDGHNIDTEINIPFLNISLEQAVPIAMIMNELFTNSIKHGFKKEARGKVNVDGEISETHFTIFYQDNGSGYEATKNGHLELSLVKLLVEQLNAKTKDHSSLEGFKLEITCPLS